MKTSQLKLSAGYYHQYLHLISNSDSPFSSIEVWLPSSPNIRPQNALHYSLDYLKYFSKPKLTFSAGAYYKDMDNQIDYKPQAHTFTKSKN